MSGNTIQSPQEKSLDENDKQEKAKWDMDLVDAFVGICVTEVQAGNRSCGHFSREGWKNVIRKFNDYTKRTYTYRQVKNKWTLLKKDWQIWNSLVGKETGLGWDHAKQTVNASSEWWDKKLKEFPEAGKFRLKGLRNADQLEFLFKDVAATGDGAWAPSQTIDIHNFGKDPVVGEQIDKNTEDDYDLDLEYDGGFENPNVTNSSPSIETTKQDNVNKRKRDYKKTGVAAKVSKQLEVLLGAVANRSSNSKSTDKPGCSIEEVMKVVKEMPEIVNDPTFFMKAADVLTERKNREMFVALSEPNIQIMWLMNKKV